MFERSNIRDTFSGLADRLAVATSALHEGLESASFGGEIEDLQSEVTKMRKLVEDSFVVLPDGRSAPQYQQEAILKFMADNNFSWLMTQGSSFCVTNTKLNQVTSLELHESGAARGKKIDLSALSDLDSLHRLAIASSREIISLGPLSDLPNFEHLDLLADVGQDAVDSFRSPSLKRLWLRTKIPVSLDLAAFPKIERATLVAFPQTSLDSAEHHPSLSSLSIHLPFEEPSKGNSLVKAASRFFGWSGEAQLPAQIRKSIAALRERGVRVSVRTFDGQEC